MRDGSVTGGKYGDVMNCHIVYCMTDGVIHIQGRILHLWS